MGTLKNTGIIDSVVLAINKAQCYLYKDEREMENDKHCTVSMRLYLAAGHSMFQKPRTVQKSVVNTIPKTVIYSRRLSAPVRC
jgi:hypothetical protein